jgi:hypothetical protein
MSCVETAQVSQAPEDYTEKRIIELEAEVRKLKAENEHLKQLLDETNKQRDN